MKLEPIILDCAQAGWLENNDCDHGRIVDHMAKSCQGSIGGFGAFVLHMLAERGALDRGLKVRTLVLPDIFQDHDKPEAMYARAGLDAEGIVKATLNALDANRAKGGLRAL